MARALEAGGAWLPRGGVPRRICRRRAPRYALRVEPRGGDRSWRDLDEMFAPLEELAREAVQGLGLRLADVHGLPLLMPT